MMETNTAKPKRDRSKAGLAANAAIQKVADATKLKTGGAEARRPEKSKSKKGGAEKIADVAQVLKGIPGPSKIEELRHEFSDTVSKLSEKVDKAELTLGEAKEQLKEARAEFNKLSRQLRDATKLLADITAGRAVPRDLFT